MDEFLAQGPFLKMLALERKRTERSHRSFVLMLLASDRLLHAGNKEELFAKVLNTLLRSARETDVKGWYEAGSVIGVIFTEIDSAQRGTVANALLAKISKALGESLSIDQINEISISFHVFPEDWDGRDSDRLSDSALYPDLPGRPQQKKGSRLLKRSMDIAGSVFALVFLSPVFLLIAVLIKLSSRGPILFRQERIGEYGRRFTFLKFRSMECASDPAIHERYMKGLISGADGSEQQREIEPTVYKLTSDPRVTPLGRVLRKTSLDELPQFFSVLKGEMSLVGPRPAIPYELRYYDLWHKRRVLAVKPGITGLWQVEGRSRVTFNDMVRMDLRYASSWSIWMDLNILLRTPGAVLSGVGAY